MDRRGKNRKRNIGFTLIELLVVVAILAILATVIVIAINPGELLKQSRDASRMADLATINKAIGLLVSDQSTISFASTTLGYAYISVPATNANCSDIGMGAGYVCATTSNYKKVNGQGWIPIDLSRISSGSPLSKLPTDPTNTTSTGYYYIFVADPTTKTWKISALLESTKYASKATRDGGVQDFGYEVGTNLKLGASFFPSGWIKVPGNSLFATSDFWVMKYEAKCSELSDPNVGLISPDTGAGGYDFTIIECSGAPGRMVVSLPDGYPIVNIMSNIADGTCKELGSNYHILSNTEYMTIAHNVAGQSANWQGGIGTGTLFVGHTDIDPSMALEATSSDSNGYYGTGNSSPSNQKRTFSLSNGSVIWDLSGNVSESNEYAGEMRVPTCPDLPPGDSGWCEYSTVSPTVYIWYDEFPYYMFAPSNPSWYSDQGVGKVYTLNEGGGWGELFYRGGAFNNQIDAGLYSVRFGSWIGTAQYDLGFRCARN